MPRKESKGEGNREADRRYRRGVRETVENTTEQERERLAEEALPRKKDREEAMAAEEKGRSRARH